jgi:hypothetical protein
MRSAREGESVADCMSSKNGPDGRERMRRPAAVSLRVSGLKLTPQPGEEGAQRRVRCCKAVVLRE